MEGQGL